MNQTFSQFFLDMLNSALGVFGGFGFAVFLQNRTEKKIKKGKLKLIIDNIAVELNDIAISLQQYIDINKCLDCRIQTPSWDAILSSGIVLDLLKEPMYTDTIRAYSKIKSFNDERRNQTINENISNLEDIIKIARKVVDSI
jgi:hypothetical protein